MNWNTLVAAPELAAALDAPDLVVVDCRVVLGDRAAGEAAWRQGHLPGAGFADLERELSDHRKPASEGRHPLPQATEFCATLVRLGIRPESQVVAYDAGEGALAAARFWWLLRLLGHRRVAVLDGGLARWQALGLPLDTSRPEPQLGQYAGAFDLGAVVTTASVQARLGDAPGWLLDARAAERFRGEVEPLDPVAGHIPGARNRPLADNLRAGVFKPAEELKQEFAALLAGREPGEVVLSCGSGVTACHNLLAMEHAGLPGARIYAASWSGWISDRQRPIAIGPA